MNKIWLRFIDLESTGCDVCQLQMQIKTTRLVLFVSWRGKRLQIWKHYIKYSGPTQEDFRKKKLKLKWTQVDNLARLVVTWGLVSGVGRQGEDDDGMFVGASLLWLPSYSTQQWHLVDCCNNRSHSSPKIYNTNIIRSLLVVNLFSKSWFTQYKVYILFIQSQLESGSLEGETKSFIVVYRSLICIHLGLLWT